MVFNNFKYLDREYKHRFLRMCLILLPQFKSAYLRSNGKVVFIRRKGMFGRVKTDFTSLVSDVISILSLLRWNTEDLVKNFSDELDERLSNFVLIKRPTMSEETRAIELIIDFLHEKFTSTHSLTSFIESYQNSMIVQTRFGRETILVDDNLASVFSTMTRDKLNVLTKLSTYKSFPNQGKRFVFVTIMAIFLAANTIINLLWNMPDKVRDPSVYSGIIKYFPFKIRDIL